MTSTESSRVPAGRILLVACFGAFLAFLDATIVNVAFPSIRESFPSVSISGLSWVLNAYNIVFAAFLIVFGRLTDLLGRRRSFVGGVVVFTVASVLCGRGLCAGIAVVGSLSGCGRSGRGRWSGIARVASVDGRAGGGPDWEGNGAGPPAGAGPRNSPNQDSISRSSRGGAGGGGEVR